MGCMPGRGTPSSSSLEKAAAKSELKDSSSCGRERAVVEIH